MDEWFNSLKSNNPLAPRPITSNCNVSFLGVGSLLRRTEINQTPGEGTKIRNHNVEILRERGLPTTHGCRVCIICPSTVSHAYFLIINCTLFDVCAQYSHLAFFEGVTMSVYSNSNDNALKVNDKAQWNLHVFMSSTMCIDDTKPNKTCHHRLE